MKFLHSKIRLTKETIGLIVASPKEWDIRQSDVSQVTLGQLSYYRLMFLNSDMLPTKVLWQIYHKTKNSDLSVRYPFAIEAESIEEVFEKLWGPGPVQTLAPLEVGVSH